jgi:hypothetical protein
VYNYGASLQAYALMKYLETLGHDVEIIDYMPEYLSRRYNLWFISSQWSGNFFLKLVYFALKVPGRFIHYMPRKKAFDRFTKKYLKLTTRTYHSNEELKADVPFADIYIAGSDQIWNSKYPNGKDPSFYLDFALNDSVKASYAASFSVNHIEKGYEEQVKLWIKKLDHISVRELTGLTILESIGIQGVQVLDPVFLLPESFWCNMAKEIKIKGKYILIYDFENNPAIEHFAKEISTKTGYPIIAIKDDSDQYYANKLIKNASPLDFIGLIKNCEIFISNSFHGAAFSIIFNKEFYTFNRMYHEVNSRMKDLLYLLGIENRLVIKETQIEFEDKIDYFKVNALLSEKIMFSKKYLDQVCSINQ